MARILRKKRCEIRCTVDEYREIRAAAKRTHQSIAVFVRRVLLTHVAQNSKAEGR